jgi:hypothetical protein
MERGEGERGEVRWSTVGVLHLYRGQGRGQWQVIKMRKRSVINGDETAQF